MEFSDQQRVFLATICAYFHEKAAWPIYRFLDRRLKDQMEVLTVGQELRSFMYEAANYVRDSEWEPKRQQTLSIRALYTCRTEGIYPELKEDLDAFMHVVRLIIEKYDAMDDDDESDPHITSAEACQQFPMSDLLLRKVYLLLDESTLVGTHWIRGGDGNEPLEWDVSAWSTVRDYRGVRTIEAYLEKRRERSERARAQARGVLAYPTGLLSVTSASSASDTQSGAAEIAASDTLGTDVFIVYGHARGARFEVAHFIESQLKLRAIMLDQIPEALSMGIFEAIETYAASAGFAVVVMTPDDVGGMRGTDTLYSRTRQNVLIELGYFWHMLGKKRLLILKQGDVEIPSDFAGILYAEMDEPGAWREKLRMKIRAAGLVE